MRKRSNHILTDCYLYLSIYIEKCMMSILRGPARTQNMSMQKMNNSKMSTQKMNSFHVCSTYKS